VDTIDVSNVDSSLLGHSYYGDNRSISDLYYLIHGIPRVGIRTLIRWMKLPEFQKAYREARRAAFNQSIARLQQGTSAAATTLIKLLIEPGTPAAVRARVADSLFNHAAKAIEI
jgi:hypothetical protein